jgi:cysteinyl-tRNA synthetase
VGEVQLEGRLAPVFEALGDDLNTPKALGALFRGLEALGPEDGPAFQAVLYALGLDLTEAAPALSIPPEIQALAEARWAARAAKNWAEADRLREALKAQGWLVKDGKAGYELSPVDSSGR